MGNPIRYSYNGIARTISSSITNTYANAPVVQTLQVKRNHKNLDGKYVKGTLLFILKPYVTRSGQYACYSMQELNQFLEELNNYMDNLYSIRSVLRARTADINTINREAPIGSYDFLKDGTLIISKDDMTKYIDGLSPTSNIIVNNFKLFGVYDVSDSGSNSRNFDTIDYGSPRRMNVRTIKIIGRGVANVLNTFPGNLLPASNLCLLMKRYKWDPNRDKNALAFVTAGKCPPLKILGWASSVLTVPNIDELQYYDDYTGRSILGEYFHVGSTLLSPENNKTDGYKERACLNADQSPGCGSVLTSLTFRSC